MQKMEEEEELGEEEEKADEAMEEVEQEVGPPLLTPLSEDAGNGSSLPRTCQPSSPVGTGEKAGGGGEEGQQGCGGISLGLSRSLICDTGLVMLPPSWGYGNTSVL